MAGFFSLTDRSSERYAHERRKFRSAQTCLCHVKTTRFLGHLGGSTSDEDVCASFPEEASVEQTRKASEEGHDLVSAFGWELRAVFATHPIGPSQSNGRSDPAEDRRAKSLISVQFSPLSTTTTHLAEEDDQTEDVHPLSPLLCAVDIRDDPSNHAVSA